MMSMPCVYIQPVGATTARRGPKLPRVTAITAVNAQRRPPSGAPEAKITRAKVARIEAGTPVRRTFRHPVRRVALPSTPQRLRMVRR